MSAAPPTGKAAGMPPVGTLSSRARDVLTGVVETVTFHSEENGFAVLKCRVKGEKDLVPVLGHTPLVNVGEYITAHGEWVIDRNHGRQFKSEVMKIDPPSTPAGIELYLGSGMVKGIGPVLAKRLVAHFGADVFVAMEEPLPSTEPIIEFTKKGKQRLRKPKDERRLLKVEGVGSLLANRIQKSWVDQKHVREIMMFLLSHAVSNSKAARIYKKYGVDAIAKVEADPYCLARDIRGIGFLSADKIAQHMGVPLDSPVRARAGVSHVLSEATDDGGHCGLPFGTLVANAVELLGIPQSTIVDAISHELAHGAQLQGSGERDHPLGAGLIEATVDGQRGVFLPSLYHSEQSIAHHLKRLARAPVPWPTFNVERAIPWVEGKIGITLAESQKQAVRVAVGSKVLVITGGPGVGKTTLLNSILRILTAKQVRTLLAAPTGKAAKRMSEATGMPAKTIHRLLEGNPAGGFKRNRDNPLDCDLLVVDESSMIDVVLAAKLLDAVGTGAAVIFVGDVDQLPSVGPGQFLVDMIESGVVDVVRLTEVFRQAATSRIIRAAHQINRGQVPQLPVKGEESDFHFFQEDEPERIAEMVVELVRNFVPKRFGYDPIRDIQVLCPMKSGVTGSRNLNVALQQALNPPGPGSVEKYGSKFSLRDKVMQIENDYDKDVFNGDMGTVVKIDSEEDELTVEFDGRPVVYPYSELDELVLCYAMSVHKSQGSEYPVVIMPVSTQHYTMLQRNLIYTGVTRGKSRVICVGTTKAMSIAVRNRVTGRRFSKLVDWLRAALPPLPQTKPPPKPQQPAVSPSSATSVKTGPAVAVSPVRSAQPPPRVADYDPFNLNR